VDFRSRLYSVHRNLSSFIGAPCSDGMVLGLVGAYALGRAMQSTLYGTDALSLPVLFVVGLVLLGAALVACYAPARRASAVDPMIVLRQE